MTIYILNAKKLKCKRCVSFGFALITISHDALIMHRSFFHSRAVITGFKVLAKCRKNDMRIVCVCVCIWSMFDGTFICCLFASHFALVIWIVYDVYLNEHGMTRMQY